MTPARRRSRRTAAEPARRTVMAVAVRGGDVAGVVLHTDGGSEYTARTFREACARMGISQSMGRPGSALDNAAIESWHSTLTFELLDLEQFSTRAQARSRVAAWIDEYNRDGQTLRTGDA